MIKILKVSFHRGRPFIEDTADELIKKDYVVWHLILSSQTLIKYNKGEKKQFEYKFPIQILNNVFVFKEVYKIICQNDFQIIHFHPTYWLYSILILFIRKKNIKVIGTVWGTDFYQSNLLYKMIQRPFYSAVDLVAFTNPKTKFFFTNKYKSFAHKCKVLRFGLKKFDLIDSLRDKETKKEMKEKLGFPSDKNLICIGYNGSQNQNHIQIIRSIANIDINILEEYVLVFPISYGGTEIYLESIKNELININVPYIFIEEYISDQDVCRLRLVSDIFIQVQTSDQFSGAMQEAIYAGSTVITGSWLPYDLLVEKGIELILVDEIAEISKRLPEAISNSSVYSSTSADIIYSISGFKNIIPVWEATYRKLLK